jgi:ribose-phosphate pyrophosphokinase
MPKEMMLFAGNSHLEFANEVAEHLMVSLHEPDMKDVDVPTRKGQLIKWFSNGNCLVDIKRDVRGADCFIIQTQAFGKALNGRDEMGNPIFGNDLSVSDHLMELWLMAYALKSAEAKSVTAVVPYLPYIRSDKKDSPRVGVGIRLIADFCIVSGINRILTMDPHFEQIHAVFNEPVLPVNLLRSKPISAKYIKENFDLTNAVMVASDASEGKRAGSMAQLLGLDMAIIDKRREGDDEQARAVAMIGDVEGKSCLLTDDETSSGGTIIEAAEYCERSGAKDVIAFVTHGVLSVLPKLQQLQEMKIIKQVIVTDTIPVPEEKRFSKLTIVPVSRNFANAIKIIFEQKSLDGYKRSLYDEFDKVE